MKRIHSKKRNLAIAIGSGIAALGIGVLAANIWLTTTTENAPVTAGAANVTVSSDTAGATGSGTTSLTFAALGSVLPSFVSPEDDATYTNAGPGSVTLQSFTVSSTPGVGANSTALDAGLSLCIVGAPTDGQYPVLYNGPLSAAGDVTSGGVIPESGSATYSLWIFAGSEVTGCGDTPAGQTNIFGLATDDSAPLPQAAAAGSDAITITGIF